jgi:hypothetical protein
MRQLTESERRTSQHVHDAMMQRSEPLNENDAARYPPGHQKVASEERGAAVKGERFTIHYH